MRRRREFSPAQLLSLHIIGLIIVGAVLLSLPVSAVPGRHVSPLDALFTSTSAVCVTGLIVVDTPNHFSPFGQVVLMLLIQAGGLGYMTISSLIMVAFGRRISIHERMTLADALNVTSMEGLLRFTWTVALLTFTIEGIGALIMGARFAQDVGWAKGLWFGLFHAVSAFNNAGFALFSDNLMGYRGDLTINLVITTLIIAGGLGFFVLSGLLRLRKRTAVGMSVHTKLVLTVSASLIVAATLVILALEWANPNTLGPLGVGEKLLAAYFQAVTPRTAGFNTISIGDMTSPALFLTICLMFIGAAPGGTGGGVKVTTFGVIMAAVWANGARPPRRQRVQAAPAAGSREPGLLAGDSRRHRPRPRHRPPAAGRAPGPAAHQLRGRVGVRHRRIVDGRRWQPAQPVGLFRHGREGAHHLPHVHGPRRPAHPRRRAGRRRRAAVRAVPGRKGVDRLMKKQTFAVIGLGRFGSAMSQTLTELGQDVIGIDSNAERVQKHADLIRSAIELDANDERALRTAGVQDVDVAVISIGENIEASLLAVMLVKDLGVPRIIAKAVTTLHGRILERIGVNRVIFPEREMAIRVAHSLVVANVLEYIELSRDFSIIEMPAPQEFIGKSLKQLQLRNKYGLTLIAIKRKPAGSDQEVTNVAPAADDEILDGDVLALLGSNDRLAQLDRLLKLDA